MHQVMLLELGHNFRVELAKALRAENVRVWQVASPGALAAAIELGAQPKFAIMDSVLPFIKKSIPLIAEFRRCFPDVPLIRITGLASTEQQTIMRIKGKSETQICIPGRELFEQIENALHDVAQKHDVVESLT